jgi:Tol biopolymer transport system component/plastocyanin
VAPDAVVGEGFLQSAPAQATVVEVAMQPTSFNPAVITATVGSIVRWTNSDTNYHTSTSDLGLWDSGAMPPGYQYAVRFLTPATYTYHCRYHRMQGMVGRIVIQGSAPPPIPTAAPPAPQGEIVFADWNGPFQSDAFTVQANGAARTNLTNSADLWEAQPSWSPERARVALTRRTVSNDAPSGNWSIHVVDRATGGATAITAGPEDYEPDWSPDGGRILFTRITRTSPSTTIQSAIYVMAPDGSGAHPLLAYESQQANIGNPAWSPDMAQIVFTVAGGTGLAAQPGDLYKMNADGSAAALLFAHSGWDDIDPAWSPNGRYVAFASGIWRGATNVTDHMIWLYDLQTSQAGVLVAHATADLRGPAWSPDGRRIAFSAEVSTGRWNLYVYDLATRTVSGPITTGVEADWAGEPGVPGTPPAPTMTPLAGTPTVPPFPTFPPGSPPPPPPFPTLPPPEPTSTGEPPTFPPPPVPTDTEVVPPTEQTPSPSATSGAPLYDIFAPAVYNLAPIRQ